MTLHQITEKITSLILDGRDPGEDEVSSMLSDDALAEFAETTISNFTPEQFLSDCIERMSPLEAAIAAKAVYAANPNGAVVWRTFRDGLKRCAAKDVLVDAYARAEKIESAAMEWARVS